VVSNMKSGWLVDLTGELVDLRELERIPFPAKTELVVDGDRYQIRLAGVSADEDPWDVFARAQESIKVVNGAARLYVDKWRNVTCSGPMYVSDDGHRNLYVLAEAGEVRVRMGTPTVTVKNAAGEVISPPREATASEMAIAAADRESDVEKVLRLYGASKLDFRDLYVIYEVIEKDVGGLDALVAAGWITKSDAKRFKHTANSVAILGDDARHGAESTDPPKQPTSLEEAGRLISGLARAWIESKP
jgi:hypothetical protein